MRRWLDGCERLLTLFAALATFIMMLLTTADAFGRYLLNRPILAAYELTTNYLMVAAIFLAMPYAYRQGANIRVTFLAERLRGKVKLAIDYAVQIVSILYCAALVVATWQQARHMLATKTTVRDPRPPPVARLHGRLHRVAPDDAPDADRPPRGAERTLEPLRRGLGRWPICPSS